MDLPDLPPGMTFERLSSTRADIDEAYEFKRAALGPYVVQRWGWQDALQREVHDRHFAQKPFFRIRLDGRAVGTLSIAIREDHIRFGEFYLSPHAQRAGHGTAILRHCLMLADADGRPVRLEYLHWNPVGSLYRRHGFVEVGRSDIHCFMERPRGGG